FMSSPSSANVTTSAEPPYENKGSGTPITGASPITIATLSTAGQNKHPTTPIASSAPNSSFELPATTSPQSRSVAYSASVAQLPTKPHSSASTENAKSVCCAGRKRSWVWVPSR